MLLLLVLVFLLLVQVIVCFSDGIYGSQGSSHAVHQRVIGAVAGGCSLLAIAVAIFVICFYRKKKKFDSKSHPMPKSECTSFSFPPELPNYVHGDFNSNSYLSYW